MRLASPIGDLISLTCQSCRMSSDALARVAGLLGKRNEIDAEIAAVMSRPMTSGHLGEWIASRIFDLDLESSATAPGIDGRFRSGPLAGKAVNVKWYLKDQGVLDIATSGEPDYYLVLAGPRAPAASSRGTHRPWTIRTVYLVDAPALMSELRTRGVAVGVATSVRRSVWQASEVYPTLRSSGLLLDDDQRALLKLFAR